MGKEYWTPFLTMLQAMLNAGTISVDDLDLMLVTDSVDDAIIHIEKHAVEQFGLQRRKAPRPSKLLGESALS